MAILSGAEIIIECLKEQGVDTVFGYPGGTVLEVYDALYRLGGIRHILTAHEQGAAHAADGYARSTGRVGVCMVTSGPGATNLVTGIATAYMDSSPMVAITVNVSTDSLGKDSFQEVDIAGITMPVTKHGFIVKDITKLAYTLRRAFTIAASGRPGPVLVDITRDVTVAQTEFVPELPEESSMQSGRYGRGKGLTPAIEGIITESGLSRTMGLTPTHEGRKEEIKQAAKLLAKAKRPLLVLGGGAVISNASAAVRRLCEVMPMPAADTLMGKGVFPGTDKAYLGMTGIHGSKAANAAMASADVVLAVGTRFSERMTGGTEDFLREARLIHVDIDRAELNKNVTADVAIAGDAAQVLDALAAELEKHKKETESRRAAVQQWTEELLKKNRAGGSLGTNARGCMPLTGADVVRTVYEKTKGQAIVVTEVGLNQMWAAQNYLFTRTRQLITSGGLGTMGFGLGAAIGAQIGNPDATVINFAGDGCFRMNMNELITAAELKLPIVEIIFDNGTLGMVYQMQKKSCDGRYSQTVLPEGCDYVKLAQTLGAGVACSVRSRAELVKAVEAALTKRTLSVIVCEIQKEDDA